MSCASYSCDQEGLKIITLIIWAVLTSALAAHRRLPGSEASTNVLGEARLTLPVPTDLLTGSEQPARASSEPSCNSKLQGQAHTKELLPWPKHHTRHRRNYSHTRPRAVLSPNKLPPSAKGTPRTSPQQNTYSRAFPTKDMLLPLPEGKGQCRYSHSNPASLL